MNRMCTSCQLPCRMVSISFTPNKHFSSLSAVGRYFVTATEKVIINRQQASRNVFNHLTRSLHVDVEVHLIILQYTYQQFDEQEASSLVWEQESLVTKLRAAYIFLVRLDTKDACFFHEKKEKIRNISNEIWIWQKWRLR